ncbi:hypothetical protein [Chitinivibrio alkaliphilus]|uniref:Uncharacterized protein n=1 Tax=Chitinivibrio alkaliphilus ACht1 TaxID=1313304 RepID=U7DAD6_9BACT|nr:hypothetical protein [Chitinivibrio alkaliphilus]ERP31355.1 hypothetical protein CALK_1700 [Chitinivibrio alkaliphilus ACht1]
MDILILITGGVAALSILSVLLVYGGNRLARKKQGGKRSASYKAPAKKTLSRSTAPSPLEKKNMGEGVAPAASSSPPPVESFSDICARMEQVLRKNQEDSSESQRRETPLPRASSTSEGVSLSSTEQESCDTRSEQKEKEDTFVEGPSINADLSVVREEEQKEKEHEDSPYVADTTFWKEKRSPMSPLYARILKKHEAGSSEREIARELSLSIDQVRLILSLAKK